MACLSPSQHLFNSFIVDFDDLDPDVHSRSNNKQAIKSAIQHAPSVPDDIKNNNSGDPDADSTTDRSRGVHGMTLSPSLVLPHTSLSSPSDSASPLSPPNSDSSASSNASPAVPLLSLDNQLQTSPSPASHTSPSSTPPIVFVKSELVPDGVLTESDMEHAHGQLPMGPDRLPPDFQRNPSAGKGGCWTCRIRRKKCDEIRVGESCSTCIRLNIDCLGWGPKRPAWMRDKQAVETYKAGIKDKLIKEGKVRGQPRAQPNQHTGTMSTPQRSVSGPSMTRGGGSPAGYPAAGPSFVASGPVTSTSAQAQHAHGQRYGPYPSPNAYVHSQLHPNIQAQLQQQQQQQQATSTPMYSSSPSTPSSTLSTLGSGFDYFAFEGQQLPGHQGPMRRATVSVPVSRHLHSQHHQQVQERMLEQRRRAYQEHQSALHLQHQPTGGSPHGQPQGSSQSFGGPSNEQSYGSIDFSGSMYGGMGSVSAMGGSMSSVSSSGNLNVPTMNMSSHYTSSGLTNSPMMLPTDDTTFSGGYVAAAQQQHIHYVSRPSRSGSGSTSSSTPSSGSHLQLASGIPHSGSTVAASTFSDALMDQSLVEPHLRYHFENVLPMQYVFGSDKAHGILQSLIARDPFGPLTNSLCAMAALHNKKVRVAQGLDQPDNTTANQFFDRAYWQLVNTSSRASSIHSTSAGTSQAAPGYSETDALAAIHLVGFFLLKDGRGDWSAHLDTAREWLLQTGLCTEGNHNPKATLATMSDAEQLAVKMVIWYDIFAAISLHQSPRFMSLCRRLLGRGSDFSEPHAPVDMDLIMGCPDKVLLILAETADLAQWKRQQHQLGILSVKELVRKGEAIEAMLNEYVTPANAMQIQHMHPSRPSGEHNAPPLAALVQTERMNVVVPLTETTGASGSASALSRPVSAHASPARQSISLPTQSSSALTADPSILSSASSAPLKMNVLNVSSRPSSSPSLHARSELQAGLAGNLPEENNQPDTMHLVSVVFRETATLYLHSVINDPSPGVPEVKHSMNRLFATLQSLPPAADRALILPLALAGCLTNDQNQGQYIRSRLSAQDESFGNIRATRLLIEHVWQAREQSRVVDWHDVMRDQLGIELLLI